jgi:hypothetical protein
MELDRIMEIEFQLISIIFPWYFHTMKGVNFCMHNNHLINDKYFKTNSFKYIDL